VSIDFYDRNGEDFFQRTKDLDMEDLYRPFLELLPANGRILDAGCGSGRDVAAFARRGYSVTGFDASATLVQLARGLTGLPILHMTFQDMEFDHEFDGIWACASLLHVPRSEMRDIFPRFIRALKPGGVWYLSFKLGHEERTVDGRHFTDMDEAGLSSLVSQCEELLVVKIWETVDIRPGRPKERWLNALLQKQW